jgi:tripartite-type tricarboxylate transporter receptor subunit TctC
MHRSLFGRSLVGLGLALVAGLAGAQNFAGKPVRIIVPFAAGGANDLNARSLQGPLGKALGGTVVVENMAGGSTKIAVDHLMRAAPDGHTLILVGAGPLMGYYYSGTYEAKVWEQLTLLGRTGSMPWVVIEARADAPYKTWPELVEYAKRNPGKLSAGGPAKGGIMELTVVETAKNAGIDVTYVPFQGGGPSGLALLGGHVAYRVAQASEVYPNVQAGKTRALGVGSPVRMPELPDVPTLKQLGALFDIPPFGFDLWGPAGMSPAVAQQISAALEQAVKDPEYVAISRKFVYDPVFTGPAALKDSIRYFDTEVGPRLVKAFPPEPAKK